MLQNLSGKRKYRKIEAELEARMQQEMAALGDELLPAPDYKSWNLDGKSLPMVIEDGASILRGDEPMTLHVRATAKDGRLEGVLMSQAAPKEAEHLAFALEGWRMEFAERDHLAFHSEHPKGGTKRSLIVCADTDRLPETKTFDIVIRRKGTDELEMWVNGFLTDVRHWVSYSGTAVGGSIWGGFGKPLHDGKLVFGSNPDGTDPFAGTLESAAVWNRSLDDAELETLFARKLDRSCFIPESESVLERRGETEWIERELGYGRFGCITDRAQIEKRIAFFDREIPALRERFVNDDASHYPRYHVSLPGESWNNHIFYHNGRWHLFVAWSAGGNFTYFTDTNREGIFWQHLSTPDWVNWTFHPWPVRTARQSDNGAFFIDDNGTAVALYYGGNQRQRAGQAARAESHDPLLERWELFKEKGRIKGIPEKFKRGRYDPSGVFKKNDTWYLWTSCLHRVKGTGFFLPLFSSKDAVDWTYAGDFYAYDNDQGLNEGGQMAMVDGKAALFFSHYMERVPGFEKGAAVLIGEIDNEGRFCADAFDGRSAHEVGMCATDNGKGQAIVLRRARSAKNRRFQRSSGEGWVLGYTMPHVATLGPDKTLRYAPPAGFEALRGKHAEQKIDHLAAGAEVPIADGIDARQMEVILRIPETGKGRQGFRLSDGESVLEACYDQEKREFVLDSRRMDGAQQSNPNRQPIIWPDKREITPGFVTLRFYADRSFFDLFGDNVAFLTDQAFFKHLDRVKATVFSEGAAAENLALDAWQMKPISFTPSPTIAK